MPRLPRISGNEAIRAPENITPNNRRDNIVSLAIY
jgi:hypothetical protein